MPLPYNAPSTAGSYIEPLYSAIHIVSPILAQITRGGNTAAQGRSHAFLSILYALPAAVRR